MTNLQAQYHSKVRTIQNNLHYIFYSKKVRTIQNNLQYFYSKKVSTILNKLQKQSIHEFGNGIAFYSRKNTFDVYNNYSYSIVDVFPLNRLGIISAITLSDYINWEEQFDCILLNLNKYGVHEFNDGMTLKSNFDDKVFYVIIDDKIVITYPLDKKGVISTLKIKYYLEHPCGYKGLTFLDLEIDSIRYFSFVLFIIF